MKRTQATTVQLNGRLPSADQVYMASALNIKSQQKFNELNQHSASFGDEHDETNISKLMENLPGKVYQNCQRTARVIMLTQLQKAVVKSKKLKTEMAKQLQQFLPKKGESEGHSEYTGKTKYFKSIHYSRVRIGQRNFIKNILLNPLFKQKFEGIFKTQNYERCSKARKNEHSQVSFEVRKKVINYVISEYESKFRQEFYETKSESGPEQKVEQKICPKIEQQKQSLQKEQQRTQISSLTVSYHYTQNFHYLFYLPLVPIPLTPPEYECYQRRRTGEF